MAVEFLHPLRDPGCIIGVFCCLVEVVYEGCCFEDCLLGFNEEFPAPWVRCHKAWIVYVENGWYAADNSPLTYSHIRHPPSPALRLREFILLNRLMQRNTHRSRQCLSSSVSHFINIPPLCILIHAQQEQCQHALQAHRYEGMEQIAIKLWYALGERTRGVVG